MVWHITLRCYFEVSESRFVAQNDVNCTGTGILPSGRIQGTFW